MTLPASPSPSRPATTERDPAAPALTAFLGTSRIAAGTAAEVARVLSGLPRGTGPEPLVIENATGRSIDLDLTGAGAAPAPADATETAAAGRGRPRLGVVAREVTLLPRHWDWLQDQPGGASAALRRLVDEARKAQEWQGLARRVREATNRFMTAAAGDLPGYEEATRALFADDFERFDRETEVWPEDIRDHARAMARGGFA